MSPSPAQSSSLPLKALWEFVNWEVQLNNGHMAEVQNMVIHTLVLLRVMAFQLDIIAPFLYHLHSLTPQTI